jgi:hypothetical protein
MPVFETDGHKGQYTDRPSQKFEMGTNAAEKKVLTDKISFAAGAPLLNGDTIEGPILPANCKILDAKIKISTPAASAGILQFGHKANTSGDSLDATGLVTLADAGGQNVLERADADSDAIYKKFDSPTQLLLTCTETFDDACDIEIEVEYSNS